MTRSKRRAEGLSLDAALQFMQVLWALDHQLQTRSKRMRSDIGVTSLQRLVLRLVARNDRASAGDLARTLHLHPSTLTGVLARLERQNLLHRAMDPVDRRRASFRVTPAARTLLARPASTVEHAVARLLGQQPTRRIATVRAVLDQLISILEQP